MNYLGEGKSKRKKHQPEYRRQWRKRHISIHAKTLKIRSDLLNQTPSDERTDSVYTDGAYDMKLCRQVISDHHVHAVIPPRKNTKPWKDKKLGSLDRNELLKTVKRLGRTLWKSGLVIIDVVWSKPRCITSNLTKQYFSGDKLSKMSFDS